jgi:hypothetical protein
MVYNYIMVYKTMHDCSHYLLSVFVNWKQCERIAQNLINTLSAVIFYLYADSCSDTHSRTHPISDSYSSDVMLK